MTTKHKYYDALLAVLHNDELQCRTFGKTSEWVDVTPFFLFNVIARDSIGDNVPQPKDFRVKPKDESEVEQEVDWLEYYL